MYSRQYLHLAISSLTSHSWILPFWIWGIQPSISIEEPTSTPKWNNHLPFFRLKSIASTIKHYLWRNGIIAHLMGLSRTESIDMCQWIIQWTLFHNSMSGWYVDEKCCSFDRHIQTRITLITFIHTPLLISCISMMTIDFGKKLIVDFPLTRR